MNKFIKIILIFFAIVIIVLVIRKVIKTYKNLDKKVVTLEEQSNVIESEEVSDTNNVGGIKNVR